MHGEGPGGMGPGMGHRGTAFTFADPAQIEKLKTELGITPAQEAAWTKYSETVQDAAAMKVAREKVDPAAVGKI